MGSDASLSISDVAKNPAIVDTSFDALRYGDNAGYSNYWAPPDVQIASSSAYVLEEVNVLGGIWTTQGTHVSTFYLRSFYTTAIGAADRIVDPKVLFDTESNRWFSSILDENTSSVLVAVSSTIDPTGSWYIYTLAALSGYCPDQPTLGISSDKVTVSANNFPNGCSGAFIEAEYWIINKSEMVSGGSTHWYYNYSPQQFSVHPVTSTSPTTTQYMVCSTCSSGAVVLSTITGLPPQVPSIQTFTLPIGSVVAPPNATQAGSTETLDPGDKRVTSAVYQNGKIWVAFTDGCTPSGDTVVRSCFRLVQIDAAQQTIIQNIDVGDSGFYYLYPAVVVDSNGNLVVAVGYSSTSVYPSLIMTGQAVGDPANSIEKATLLKAGIGPITKATAGCPKSSVCRYGDYFGAALDPSVGGRVWLAGEYGGAAGWGTYAAGVKLTPKPSVSLALSYAVLGGGANFSPPMLDYVTNGIMTTATLSNSPTTYKVDVGTSWSVTNPLSGSSSTERWGTPQTTSGVAGPALSISFNYYHQFLVTFGFAVVGGGTGFSPPSVAFSQFAANSAISMGMSVWADAQSSYAFQTQLPGSSSSERWHATASSGAVTNPGQITVTYNHQYLLTVTGSGSQSSWYDSGSTGVLVTQGVFGRTGGVGMRITSYTLDAGAPISVAPTTKNVSVGITMNSAHTLVFTSVTQYQVSLDSGALQALNSITPPTIAGDNYWYDKGAAVGVILNGVWNRTSGIGYRLAAYSLNQAAPILVATAGTVSTLDLKSISSPQSLAATLSRQFQLGVSGGGSPSLTVAPPIPDDSGWFDPNTNLKVMVNVFYNQSADSRLRTTLWSLDDGPQDVVPDNATFATPSILMNTTHSVVFRSIAQYLTTFAFLDASGIARITPTSYQLGTENGLGERINTTSYWFDSGTRVAVTSVLWEGSEVAPANFTATTDRAATIGIHIRVYTLRISVRDSFGFGVSGAAAKVKIANGTTVSLASGANGVINVGLVPLGNFHATVTNLGTTTQISGDAASQSRFEATVPLSYPVLGISLGGASAVIATIALVVVRVRRKG